MLRQWRDALVGRDGQGYDLAVGGAPLPIAQAYVSEALPGFAKGWTTLLPGGDASASNFTVDLLIKPSAAAGDLLTLMLAAGNPAGPATGNRLELKAVLSGAGLQLQLDGTDFGQLIASESDGQYRLRATFIITGGHEPVQLSAAGHMQALGALGVWPPLLNVVAHQPLKLRFGPSETADLLGRVVPSGP